MPRLLHVRKLGLVEYDDGLAMMGALVEARRLGLIPDTLLLLEHNPVLTLGRGAREGHNILWPREDLIARGVEVHETDRGGDVTFHGPGQIVGYPILDLGGDREDVRRYIRSLEEMILGVLRSYDIEGGRAEGLPGVWVGNDKVCAIGVHIARWITSHGFALNVSTDLSYFSMIVPCGIPGRGVTSMERLTGSSVEIDEVSTRIVESARQVFDYEVEEQSFDKHTVSVYLWRRRDGADPEILLLERIPERGGFWQPVTGQVEPDEPPHDAAVRECHEETGLEADIRAIPYVHSFVWPRKPSAAKPPRFLQEHAYHVRVEPDFTPTLDPTEHTQWRWASFDEAFDAVPHAGLKRGVRLVENVAHSI